MLLDIFFTKLIYQSALICPAVHEISMSQIILQTNLLLAQQQRLLSSVGSSECRLSTTVQPRAAVTDNVQNVTNTTNQQRIFDVFENICSGCAIGTVILLSFQSPCTFCQTHTIFIKQQMVTHKLKQRVQSHQILTQCLITFLLHFALHVAKNTAYCEQVLQNAFPNLLNLAYM